MATNKGFIKDWAGNFILPITRGELVLDSQGRVALHSEEFLAGNGLPGLMTAAEKAMLSGTAGGQSLTDLYTKLGYINNGLKVNGNVLNFYDADGNSTPINITTSGEGVLAIGVANNTVNLSLKDIHTEALSASDIIKSITVDKYGRVTAVSGSKLTNAEIPTELSEKTIKNSILDTCTTSTTDIGTEDTAVANKYYVDLKFNSALGVASGALHFEGPLSNATDAVTALSNTANENAYFKATAAFTLESQYLYTETGGTESATDAKVEVGDTLIITSTSSGLKYVWIPSGEDYTRITVKGDSSTSNALTSREGEITFQFSSVFDVTNPGGGGVAYISIPVVSTSTNGYLTSDDYKLFKQYAESLKVGYTTSVASTAAGVYELGVLAVGNNNTTLYGLNNRTALELTNGATDAYDPIIKFTESGVGDSTLSITYKGTNGIKVRKNGNNIEYAALNEVIDQTVPGSSDSHSAKYLTIANGYQFGVQLGSANESGNITDGLVDFSQFYTLAQNVSRTLIFEEISYSLSGAESTTDYRYGNSKMIAAITTTI